MWAEVKNSIWRPPNRKHLIFQLVNGIEKNCNSIRLISHLWAECSNMLAQMIIRYLIYKLKHRYLRFYGRHPVIRTPGSILQFCHWSNLNVKPLKHTKCSRWNFVDNLSTSWDIVTSGILAAILDFSFPVKSRSILYSLIRLSDPKNKGVAVDIPRISYFISRI